MESETIAKLRAALIEVRDAEALYAAARETSDAAERRLMTAHDKAKSLEKEYMAETKQRLLSE